MNQIITGDCNDIMKNNINENSIDMIITSPPYNLDIKYNQYKDNLTYTDYLDFLKTTFQNCFRVLKSNGRIAINVPSLTINKEYKPLFSDVIQICLNIGYLMRGDILWYKQNISNRTAWGSFQSPQNPKILQPYEHILVFSKSNHQKIGDKNLIDITKKEFIEYSNAYWHITPETSKKNIHPAPFPKELVYRLLKYFTYKNDLILDCFGGSGTTAEVCHSLNRNFIHIDISEKYNEYIKNIIQSKLF